jgi:Tfp pilus assembly protein PilF
VKTSWTLRASLALAGIAALVVIVGGPGRAQPSPANTRERAYRENNIGVGRLERFEYGEAAAAFRRAIAIDPSLAIAHLNLAISLFYDGQLDEADREARAAIDRLPAAPQPPYVRGLIARAAGRDEEAAAAFRRVLEIDAVDPGASIQLGQVLTSMRQFPDAVRLLERALAAEPFNATAAYGIAIALTRAGRAEDGRAAMTRFQQLRDNPASITYANVYLEQGRYGEAIASTGLESELADPATPSVRFAEATAAMFDGSPPTSARNVTLADVNGDGALDLMVIESRAIAVWWNVNGRFGADSRTVIPLDGTTPAAVIAGDYDNDGRADLFVVGAPTHRLLHRNADGAFRDVTQSAAISRTIAGATTAAFVDVDHDGDLDIIVGGASGLQLLRNDGNGRFTDATMQARLGGADHAIAVVPTDFDNHRDIDLLVVRNAARPSLFSNLRDGTFRDVGADVGLPPVARFSAIAAGDINKDGATDFFFGRRGEPGLLALSDRSNRFTLVAAPDESRDAIAAQLIDYDNDGLLDLLVLTDRGARLWRGAGSSWTDVTAAALPVASAGERPTSMALGDIDGDGDVDAVLRFGSGAVRVWRNDGGNAKRSLRVNLTARVSNRSAVGSKVEIRAGSLRHRIETSSATPPVAPAGVLFGLGARGRADVVRVLWPSGILQSEVDVAATALDMTELNRKPSSCPYLFTWNGSRFEFVTDFLGGGELGAWTVSGEQEPPDSDEYVRIPPEHLQPRDGRYELRVTNELEEALFLDRVQLVAVAHPADAGVYPNEGLRSAAARPPFTLQTTRSPRGPLHAVDERGRHVTERLTKIDRRYVDDFPLEPIRGYAAPHALTFTIDTSSASRVVLLLTGWTDYAFSSDNFAAHQAGLHSEPPSLQLRTDDGRWTTIVSELGLPVGRPQTIAIDVSAVVPRKRSVDLRISTTLRVYWDQILVDTSGAAPFTLARIDPVDATLRSRGFSKETSPDGREPFLYDYDRVSLIAPWKTMPGRYTRIGDVRPLLTASDDQFVVSAPGDEIAIAFDANALPPIPAGWTRTFLLYADGFSKEMNLHSSSPDRLDPLPFHGMRHYPYALPQRYPTTPAHMRYREEYNTRVIGGPLPPLVK